ncbi:MULTISPECIES: DUF4113 domain-containing protein [Vibrio]|uniref:DUF4113 domain-containing protein n=1 Tax=Vibrio TaxID=662 RepID=UPI0009B14AEC|nr:MULTISPECIES: DUF4113 domain-containing protein [Vibrio]EHK9549197.1 DUF4113 domain-containing protein [Vibrio alginolyticus]EHK9605255.1 DUF4113 domain-containing protein [Vibrio alginolyticus]EIV1708310.1 DUF4113 domain-containing protein [Vibrio parahaemolyticus]EJE8514346.1 DUF4113 domain-containing protein [Vibrio parahaemolyticus]EJE8772990.1 DUF4113 domain-containing protein [Vibrio parahaemolyticus]
MDVYDTLNQRFGCVEQGGIAEVQMRRQMLTPQYTTPMGRFTEDQVLAIPQSTIRCHDTLVY